MTVLPELFRCAVYDCRLTHSACAERWRAARAPTRQSSRPRETLHHSRCGGCEIGAAHARGERPDVTAAQLVRREPEVVEMPQMKGKTYAHDGREMTLEMWSREPRVATLGLSAQAIRSRIEAGWLFGDAIATAKGAPRPSTSPAKRSTKPKDETPRKVPMVPHRPRKPEPEAVAEAAERIESKAAKATSSYPTKAANAIRLRGIQRAARLAEPEPAAKTLAEEVREVVAALQPDELLRAAGWDAQAVGVGPAGRIVIVVRGVAA